MNSEPPEWLVRVFLGWLVFLFFGSIVAAIWKQDATWLLISAVVVWLFYSPVKGARG